MSRFQFKKHVNAPPAHVFDLSTKFSETPSFISGITRVEMLTESPVRKGMRFKETRVMFGKEATEEMEVVAFEPGRSYTLGADSCGSRFETKVEVTPSGSGSDVSMDMNCRPVTFFAKLMSPLGFLMAGQMKKFIEKDLDDLKAAAEQQHDPEKKI